MKTYIKTALLAIVLSVIVQLAAHHFLYQSIYDKGYKDAIDDTIEIIQAVLDKTRSEIEALEVESFPDHSELKPLEGLSNE